MTERSLPSVEEWIHEWIDRLDPEQISDWNEIHAKKSDDGCSTITKWTPEQRRAVWIATREFVFRRSPIVGLSGLSSWSPRAGAWICAQLARRMLRYVSAQDQPKRLIEMMEGWVLENHPIDADETSSLLSVIQAREPFGGDPLEDHAENAFFECGLALSFSSFSSAAAGRIANKVTIVRSLAQMTKDRLYSKASKRSPDIDPEIIRAVNIEIAELIPSALDAVEKGFSKRCGS